MDGLMGKLLFIDLSTGETEERTLDEHTAKDFLGGPMLGAKILYDEMPPHTDPFAPESMLGFVSGTLNATGAFMAGRCTVVSKSPVTNGWNDANVGGSFGPELKKTGYDAVFFKGISPNPVYVFIDDGKVEIHDATGLWGKTVLDAEKMIREELGDNKICVMQTGPAGERKSLMAAVMHDGHRAAARGGTGAVMGSKNLKAFAVRGTKTPNVADKEALKEIHKEILAWQKDGPVKDFVAGFKELGTPIFYESNIYNGDASIKNWTGAGVTDVPEEAVQSVLSQARFKKNKYTCSACPVGCGAIYDVKEDDVDIPDAGQPEYETMGAFGSQMMNDDSLVINICNHLCNEYGLDTISTGATIAWAMECFSEGILSKEELDGIELTWGNSEAIEKMTEKIARGEGVGRVLQEGSRYAANYFGKGHSALVEAGGIELPQHDARFSPGLARTYQYDPTPGRHTKGGLSPQYGNQPPEIKYNYDNTAEGDVNGVIGQEILNAGGYCQFADFCLSPGAQIGLINAVTGFNYSENERRRLGLRGFIIRHAFNLREGLRRKDWTISDRAIGIPALKDGPLAGVTVDAKKIADNFFDRLGFDQEAVPLKETLEEVGGLDNVIQDLYS